MPRGALDLIADGQRLALLKPVFQALRFELFQLIVTNFVGSTQPALDTAATQFGHNAISADTGATLAAIEAYDAQLTNLAAEMDGLTTTALSDKSLLRAVTGMYAETQSILSGPPLNASQFQLTSGYVLNFLKSPVEAAVETAFAVASIAPIIGETLSIDPTSAAITAAMTGAEALPAPPVAGAVIVANGATHSQPAATTLPTPSPTASRLDATPAALALQPCARPRGSQLTRPTTSMSRTAPTAACSSTTLRS